MSFAGKLNIYRCDKCFKHIVTRDLAAGVTPFSLGCRATPMCDGMMLSSMYRVFDQGIAEDFEWYRPTPLEALEPWAKAHVANGGLLIRKADPHAAWERASAAAMASLP